MSDYPEHEKLHKVSDQSQAIGEFLDHLGGIYGENDNDFRLPDMRGVKV